MKTMTCKQLGGACNEKFSADNFDEIAEMSKKHGAEMFRRGDKEHMKAMDLMKDLMQDSNAMQEWFENRRREFEALPDD